MWRRHLERERGFMMMMSMVVSSLAQKRGHLDGRAPGLLHVVLHRVGLLWRGDVVPRYRPAALFMLLLQLPRKWRRRRAVMPFEAGYLYCQVLSFRGSC